MLTTKQKDFKRRKENVYVVQNAIKLVESEIKKLIKQQGKSKTQIRKDQIEERILLKTHILSGLIIIWSESLIKWLIYEHGAFEDLQIQGLLNRNNSNQWTGAITAAFWKAFSNEQYDPLNPLPKKCRIDNHRNINQKDKDKFTKLYELIERKLDPSIVVRNKIQHGEWVNSFSNKNSQNRHEFDSTITNSVLAENILVLKLKQKQFKAIYQIIYDLAVFNKSGKFNLDQTQTPFSFFFNKRYKQIIATQKNIDNANYMDYKTQIVNKDKRGLSWRRKKFLNILIGKVKRKLRLK